MDVPDAARMPSAIAGTRLAVAPFLLVSSLGLVFGGPLIGVLLRFVNPRLGPTLALTAGAFLGALMGILIGNKSCRR